MQWTWIRMTAACMALAFPVAAQNTDIESLSGLQFNFSNPGARSLGMGGTFLALADDASAAEANPAGLTILRKPEIAIEGRSLDITQTFNSGGTFPSPQRTDFTTRSTKISFLSAVFPWRNFAFAAYYHEPIRYENYFDLRSEFQPVNFFFSPTKGLMTQGQCDVTADCQEGTSYPFLSSLRLRLRTFGVATAWKTGALSIGGAVKYQRFNEVAYSEYPIDVFDIAVTSQNSNENAISWSTGFKLALSETLSVGGVVKHGARFAARVRSDSAFSDLQADTTFHVPDVAGLGVAYHPGNWTFGADVVRVKYSNLVDNFVTLVQYNYKKGQLASFLPASNYRVSDGTELRTGMEYFLPLRVPVALRGGWWRDPAHSIEYRGKLDSFGAVIARTVYPGSRAEDHFSAGVGVAWPKLQIDAAFDTSAKNKSASVSVVTVF